MKPPTKEVTVLTLIIIFTLFSSLAIAQGGSTCDASTYLGSNTISGELSAIQVGSISVLPQAEQAGTVFTIGANITDEITIISATARILDNETQIDTVTLYDDGQHGDGAADDSYFAGTWDSIGAAGGFYNVEVTAINQINQSHLDTSINAFEVTVGDCVPLHTSGNQADKLDVVFISCDYDASEGSLFANDAQAHMDYMFNFQLYEEYTDAMNVYYVNRPGEIRCTYNGRCISIHSQDVSKAYAQAAECGSYDTILALADTTIWGGCANFNGIARSARWAPWISVHEFAHSFGLLGDEYSYGGSGSPWSVNCDYSDCDNWAGVEGTGCYQGCTWDNLYRSTPDSAMRTSLNQDFGPFNRIKLHERFAPYAD